MRWFLGLAVTIVTSTQVTLLFAATLEITVADKVGKRLPCRIHLTDAAGIAQRAEGLPFWQDHFVCPGGLSHYSWRRANTISRLSAARSTCLLWVPWSCRTGNRRS